MKSARQKKGARKKESGAQGRARRRAEAERARQEEAARRAAQASGNADGLPLHLAHYAPVWPAPVAVNGGIAWLNCLLQIAIGEVISDPVIDATTRRKQICELGKILAMSHAKAHQQQKLAEIVAALDRGSAAPSPKGTPSKHVSAVWTPPSGAEAVEDDEANSGDYGEPISPEQWRAAGKLPTKPATKDVADDGEGDEP
jgi:hypothetical protein